jgi:hypothetical protein
LGVYLDSLEVTNLLKNQGVEEIINGQDGGPRSGFHRNNPWYDGRGNHNFTIIDVPRGGTTLTEEQINEAIYAYHLWNEYATLCNINPVIKQPITQEDLDALSALPFNERPQITKNTDNKHLHGAIDIYLAALCDFQLNCYLNAPKLLRYDENFGSHIEDICQRPANDVFLNLEEIKNGLKNLKNHPQWPPGHLQQGVGGFFRKMGR